MATNSANIDRLRIATPCPISWEQMTGDNRVRFCDHCHLNVYNISELSPIEAETLIASTEGRLCARLFRRADGTVLTKDCPVGLRALKRRAAKRTAAIFAAIVSLAGGAFGQNAAAKDAKTTCTQQTRIMRTNPGSDHSAPLISGTVLDINGAVIAGAKVTITELGANKTLKTVTDDEGSFQYRSLANGKYSLRIDASGFKILTTTSIVLDGNQALHMDMTLEAKNGTVTMGIIVDDSVLDTSSSSTTFIISGSRLRMLPIQK